MKRSTALKILLIFWSVVDGAGDQTDNLYDLFESVEGWEHWYPAMITWFGTQNPDRKTLDHFFDKYKDWMQAIYEATPSIMLGELTIDQIIVEQVTKETWL